MSDRRVSDGPRVSIIIPVFNGSDFLAQAIDSALAQTYQSVEILVVNDGSTDEGATERIARSYGAHIRYISKSNGGVASALNVGIAHMSGTYFSWLSHDDLYCPDKIERGLLARLSMDQTDRDTTIFYSDYSVFSSNPSAAIPVRLKELPPESFRYWLTVENALHGCTLLIPKRAFDECGVFDERLRTTQDFDLWFRLAKHYRFVHLPEVLVKARSHSGQGSIRMATTALAECNALLLQFTLNLTERELTGDGRRSAQKAYAEISASLWQRGFLPAAKAVARLSIQRARGVRKSAVETFWIVGRGIARYYLLRAARRLMTPRFRLALRRLIRLRRLPIGRQAQSVATSSLRQRFSEIYDGNIFGGRASRSGAGSDLIQTEVIRRELPTLLKGLGVRSFLDAPCGDWYWMRQLNLGVETYIGVDIVEALIVKNQQEFGNGSTSFHCINLAHDKLPQVDLIFSRDCLVHLSFEDSLHVIANFKRSGSKYLLTTTFTDRDKNTDLLGRDGFWRPLNMQLPPFSLPAPMTLINEGCTEEAGQFGDKCLGLWALQEIECQDMAQTKKAV
jgi:glycosyltransferase involved in cell wall biosynthesis